MFNVQSRSVHLYLVFIAVTAENAVSHRYVVANGNKTLTAFSDSSGYSQERLIQNDISDILLNCKRKDLSDDSSASSSCSRPVKSVRTHSNGFLIQSNVLISIGAICFRDFVACSRTPWKPSTDPQGSEDHRLKISALDHMRLCIGSPL